MSTHAPTGRPRAQNRGGARDRDGTLERVAALGRDDTLGRDDRARTGTPVSGPAGGALALLRIATGFVFLWAFLDKLFGLHYSTPSAGAWVRGGSPTRGFLSHVAVGPAQGLMHAIAGAWWADWLFMLGMLGIGVAVVLGIGLRLSAVAGTLIMALMWVAEFAPAQRTATGEPSGSTNPIVDYHVVYALSLVVCALTWAGHRWGLGRWWCRLPIVARHRFLL